MSDPKRWLEAGGSATKLERELLAREIATEPSEKLERAIWQRVLGALPPMGPGSPGGPSNGASGDGGLSGAGAAGAGGASAAAAGTGAGGALVGAAKASGLGVAK